MLKVLHRRFPVLHPSGQEDILMFVLNIATTSFSIQAVQKAACGNQFVNKSTYQMISTLKTNTLYT